MTTQIEEKTQTASQETPATTYTVTFVNLGKTVKAREGQSILDVALEHEIPLEHNCGGNCACSTCHVIVREGMKHLSPMQEEEEDQLDEAEGLTLISRLGCQAKIRGDIVVEIPPQTQPFRAGGH
ncbi:MAG: 2Fe-2S iron-sulfur cluster binding domain-containing protein [Nitrospirae bacterium]|nr:2Fe-2S iron-sulfur cluster binding domain-containing protein [Nitrospirota bacterium]